jgi:hypothetical protein
VSVSVRAMPEPGDAITWREAGRILDRSISTLARLVASGELTRGERWEHRQLSRRDVERLSLARWQPAKSVREGAYWVTTHRAAELLGVNGSRCVNWPVRVASPTRRHRAVSVCSDASSSK